MKYKIFTIVFVLSILSSCANNDIDLSKFPKNLNVEQFEQLVNTNQFTLIDIRDIQEFSQNWYLSWAININYYDINFKQEISKLDKNGKYLIYCNRWTRTKDVIKIMNELWFENVLHLSNWIQDWILQEKNLIKCSDINDYLWC